MLDSQKAARHYQKSWKLTDGATSMSDLGLNDLDADQSKIYTIHRRVFESNTVTLMAASDACVHYDSATSCYLGDPEARAGFGLLFLSSDSDRFCPSEVRIRIGIHTAKPGSVRLRKGLRVHADCCLCIN